MTIKDIRLCGAITEASLNVANCWFMSV